MIQYWISIIWRGREVSRPYHAKSFWKIWYNPTKKLFYHQGFFAVKRWAVFILGAMWWALVRGWWRDCVVGGMETCFQWRKAHSRTAKCEPFHVAPRLFFMFLFLILFASQQQYIIIASVIFHSAISDFTRLYTLKEEILGDFLF